MDVRNRALHADARLHAQHALIRRRLGSVALLAVCGTMLASDAATAQRSIEASPLRVELRVEPASSHTQAVTITNPGTDRVRVRATLADWHLARDGAPQFRTPVEGRPYAASAWVRFAPPEFTLDGGAAGTVRFTVTVPRDARPGGYRTGLLFEFLPETPEQEAGGRQVVIRSRVATMIYVNVGEPPVRVELTGLTVRGTTEARQIVAGLRNSSRRTVRTRGTLLVYDAAGLAVARLIVPDVPVLPESERELAIRAADALERLPAGDYTVELKLDLGMPALLVGETSVRVGR